MPGIHGSDVSRGDRNQGLNRTWHNLLTQVTGDYWCSPGADDVLKPSFLERRLRVLEQTPEAVFAHGPPEIIDTAGERCRSLPKSSGTVRLIEARQGLLHSLRCNHINQPGVLVRSCSARLRLSLFERDWKYAPDWFLWILLLAEGKKVVWILSHYTSIVSMALRFLWTQAKRPCDWLKSG